MGLILLLGLFALAVHFAFRTGWGRHYLFTAGPDDLMGGARVVAAFTLLPGALMFIVMPLGILANMTLPLPPLVSGVLTFLTIVGGLGCGAWGVKEFERPTLSRIPPWLRDEIERDPDLREIVYGRRRR